MKINTTPSEQFPRSNIKIVERSKLDNPNSQIHDGSIGTSTSITCGEGKLQRRVKSIRSL